MKILMVCLGNICRSPIAEGLMKEKINAQHLNWEVDSAGTSDWHQGQQPDRRTMLNALKHNIDISNQCSRPFRKEDFKLFDIIFAMDTSVLNDLQAQATSKEEEDKLFLLLKFAGLTTHNVPDPYSGGAEMFETVFQLINKACDKIVTKLLNQKIGLTNN